MKGISKQFPVVLANDNVDFELHSHEIHALLGENGAGKTTLMNILSGVYTPDKGEVYVDGEIARIRNPPDARRYGIGMVYQHFSLIPVFNVAENLWIGEKRGGIRLNYAQIKTSIGETAKHYGIEVNLDKRVEELSVGEQQKVEILKLLFRGARVLVLDEPTSVLTPQESLGLFASLAALKEEGKAIVVITHKLYEILGVADRVTVLRRGKVVFTSPAAGLTREVLTRAMIGAELEVKGVQLTKVESLGSLRLQSVSVRGDRREAAVVSLSLEAKRGEILGVAGVAGNGQRELVEATFGLRPMEAGDIFIDGKRMTGLGTKGRINAGLGYIPEERRTRAVAIGFTLGLNSVLHDHWEKPYVGRGMLSLNPIRRFTRSILEKFDVKGGSENAAARSLSGGNLQKFVVGREVLRGPKYMLAVNPTSGLDVAATEYVRSVLVDSRNAGLGIVLVSEDLDELLALSDRIVVMYKGKLSPSVDHRDFDKLKIGSMMLGEGF